MLLRAGMGVVLFLGITSLSWAVIETPLPLKNVLQHSSFIFVVKVQSLQNDPAEMVLERAEQIKGDAPFVRMTIPLKGDAYAEKNKHTTMMLERLEQDLPILIFCGKRGKKYVTFGFTNGTWFQMEGRIEEQDGKETVRWSFLHGEPYLRRTFKGTTEELKLIVVDGLKNGTEPPAYNGKEEPGFGPALPKKSKENSKPPLVCFGSQQLFAVIQLPFLGLIAAFAAFFPTLFAGLALCIRRWSAGLTAISLLSILFSLYHWFPQGLIWPWLQTPPGFFSLAGVISLLAGCWACSRYRQQWERGSAESHQPTIWDRAILLLLLITGAIFVLFLDLDSHSRLSMLVFFGSIGICGCFVLWIWCRRQLRSSFLSNLSAEMVLLVSLVIGCGISVGWYAGQREVQPTTSVMDNNLPKWVPQIQSQPVWVFEPTDAGAILSSPCLLPDQILVSVQHMGLGAFGRVYSLDPKTGSIRWSFDNDGDMKAVFSSPVHKDGRIYVGEGFHQDHESKLYCLDAQTGTKLWDFATKSHVESTPAVADGKVVFGAGDDGLYCLDAQTGKQIWQYTGALGLHIDCNPVITQGNVYASSGISRSHSMYFIFCLDLQTGNEIWSERVEHSAHGSPFVQEGVVYFGTGNSGYTVDRKPPGGQILARDAHTGQRIWNRALSDTVLASVQVDRFRVFANCRDHYCYALDRRDGTILWKYSLASPILTAPLVVRSDQQVAQIMYVCSEKGRLVLLNPNTGQPFWRLDLATIAERPHVLVLGNPVLWQAPIESNQSRYLYVPCGVSRNTTTYQPRLYCFAIPSYDP